MKNCYELADHIFCAPDAPQILSSTRGLLSTLHRALHEHLHACRGIQGARNISSRFPDELPRIFLSREWSIETSSHVTASRVDRMITLMTSVTDLLESSLKGDPPGQQSSTAYDPIGSDPRSFSKQLPTLIREVVLSMPNEIASKSESILKLTPLIGDSRVTGAAKSVLNAIKDCYKLADHIFCAPGALQILSSTRRLLSTLHQALHEHLHACYGIQGARIISSNFSDCLGSFCHGGSVFKRLR
ncbi:uncharacterized protein EI90DRAFT_1462317 [Cantharellus anzutake]|uniref:uncharacterized protein n=1 Tax=Cantharellus anzutake TaxID=1750568 RepID=UPI0019083D3F|nr:uncharacterized protein EI90DRAFT_2700435 [Cantharellus anzutake]XP_038914738.1 uncharacterized protein EI90DRAFT_1462317 [Cantharellus anzutake]KAF8318600.1 hypothetical protein EI90DRAFT_2700435 [Cantharellus anzutake]KAF8329180.1 hypothetical protein EI90DRAFT_1462317 [Cantharellus anzutake]